MKSISSKELSEKVRVYILYSLAAGHANIHAAMEKRIDMPDDTSDLFQIIDEEVNRALAVLANDTVNPYKQTILASEMTAIRPLLAAKAAEQTAVLQQILDRNETWTPAAWQLIEKIKKATAPNGTT